MITDEYPQLFQPKKCWRRSEILQKPCPVPKESGVYAWYFRTIPPDVLVDVPIVVDGLTLLYIGKANNLAERLRTHCDNDASWSTLRRALGCLLAKELGIELRRNQKHRNMYGVGEIALSEWMEQHAAVVWMPIADHETVENGLIQSLSLSLPLNVKGNKANTNAKVLHAKRREALANARKLPLWDA